LVHQWSEVNFVGSCVIEAFLDDPGQVGELLLRGPTYADPCITASLPLQLSERMPDAFGLPSSVGSKLAAQIF
jgi:hypothetical protein